LPLPLTIVTPAQAGGKRAKRDSGPELFKYENSL